MRPRHAAPLAILALAACSPPATSETTPPPEPVPTVTVTETPEPAPTVTVTATPDPEPTDTAAGPPAGCDPHLDDSQIESTVTPVVPEDVALLSAGGVTSSIDRDKIGVFIQLCSDGLTEDEHRRVATDAASAVDQSDQSDDVVEFIVQSWTPDGQEPERSLSVDYFDLYLWDGERSINHWE